MSEVANEVSVMVLLGIGATFLTMIGLLIFIVYRRFIRLTIRVNFISKGGKINRISKKREDINATIDYKKGSYAFDEKAIVTSNWRHEIFYFVDSTDPIMFDSDKKLIKNNINPENLKAIIETELIAKLFKKEIITFDNILLIILLVMVGVNIFIGFKLMGGVEIANTPENIELMREIIKQALASGV